MPQPANSPNCAVCDRALCGWWRSRRRRPPSLPRLLADLASVNPESRSPMSRPNRRTQCCGARGSRGHRADLQLSGRPRRSARVERPWVVGAKPSGPTTCSRCSPRGTPRHPEIASMSRACATRTGSPDVPAAADTCSSYAVAPASHPRSASKPTTSSLSRGSSLRRIGVATLPRMAVESFPRLPGVITRASATGRGAHGPRRDRARCRAGTGDSGGTSCSRDGGR